MAVRQVPVVEIAFAIALPHPPGRFAQRGVRVHVLHPGMSARVRLLNSSLAIVSAGTLQIRRPAVRRWVRREAIEVQVFQHP